MSPSLQRKIVLVARPEGEIKDSDFRLEEGELPETQPGQVRIRNVYLSIDPAIRGWLNASAGYVEPIAVGDVIRSAAIGQIAESKHEDYPEGTWVSGLMGWEEYSTLSPQHTLRKIPEKPGVPRSYYAGVLGGNGLTAYLGLTFVGKPKTGETVVVSAAAGGVGSLVGQIAKLQGCRVIGITSSEVKARWITEELGFDAAIRYRDEDVVKELKANCPKGIDVYFDNVGGMILNDVLTRINVGSRIVLCGAISQINESELPPGPSNYIRLLTKRASMQGFVTLDYAKQWPEAAKELAQWVRSGKLLVRETRRHGLEQAPAALRSLFLGENMGKSLVQICEE
jgi:NADPH-dependent curcumin reductase